MPNHATIDDKLKSSHFREGMLLGLGNALIDLTAHVDKEFLLKYHIGVDEAVKADLIHQDMLQDLEAHYIVSRTPGGSGFNVLRSCQWMLQRPNTCTFIGCIGDDENGSLLRELAEKYGIRFACQVAEGVETSTCAILVSGEQRSMCSFQKASGKFDHEAYLLPTYQRHLKNASFIYLSGFFLNVCTKTAMHLAVHAHNSCKPLIMDLGAPRVILSNAETLKNLLWFTDVLFGNNEEISALERVLGLKTSNIQAACVAIAAMIGKGHPQSRQWVITTRGKDPVVAANPNGYREFPCQIVSSSEITDVNGCGDAFLGGFLSAFIQNLSIEECISSGMYASNVVIRRIGCSFPDSKMSTA